EAIREALLNPLGDSAPLPSLLFPGMRLTIAFDDVSLPLPPMQRPDIRQRVIEAVLDAAAAAGVDDVVLVAALALHRRMTEPELRHPLGNRGDDAFPRPSRGPRAATGCTTRSPRRACSPSTTPRTPTTSCTSASPTPARTWRST